ncbi:MAG: T9SS type A sorting domain-containing protein [Bacteroidetes bacterium]|nr:T9SS type A sorting domain-containing protein [Bacteroidota bacterium]
MKLYRLFFLVCLLIPPSLYSQSPQIPIGQWRDELPYYYCNSVAEVGNRIYSSTPYALFYFDKDDNSITRITKIQGLSDIGISCIAYNTSTKTLVIAYADANLDLIQNGNIINISDIYRKTILGNKTINSIYCLGNMAYLECGFGIVVLDLVKQEIKETYYIGSGGTQVNVMSLVKDDKDTLWAATEKGIYKAWYKDPNLANYAVWKKDKRIDTSLMYNTITYFSGTVVANKHRTSGNDSLYRYNGNWSAWNTGEINPVMNLNSMYNVLVVSYNYFVDVYDQNFTKLKMINGYPGAGSFPQDAICDKNQTIWIADSYSGLVSFEMNSDQIKTFNLSGPLTANAFSMSSLGNDLYITPGGYDASFVPLAQPAQIYHFDDANWTNISGVNNPSLYGYNNIVSATADPSDPNRVYAATWGYGLLEFYNGILTERYTEANSTLHHHSAGDTGIIRVGGSVFDAHGYQWIDCSHTNQCLSLKRGNQWTGFTITINNETDLGQILANRYDQVWMQMRYGNLNANSILVFTDNGTPDNPNDDLATKLNNTAGNGNIPGTTVFSMAEDKNGEIWVGTESGVGVFYSPDDLFSTHPSDCQRPLVQQGQYTQYLLESEQVNAIAVDGSNRKWMGTDRGGVYLFSADGTKQVYHFTADNSPLLSNRVTSIAINPLTGEVYFGTDKGVISYKSTATEGSDAFGNVYAYPNPVREGYQGYIAVKGLISNAQVRITDVSGRLVFTGKAEGGQVVWNGTTMNGQRVHTGVYMVFASNETGSEKVVTKILVIN